MGLFSRRTQQERQQEAMQMADDIAQGRGLMGKMTQAFMGRDFTEAMQSATTSMHQAEYVAQLRATGVPTREATVLGMQDTGQTINDNPNIVLTLDVEGQQVAVATLVSRLEIPRVGEKVLVLREPQNGHLLYAGLAPRT
ncbi:hypothetical protein [Microbacterium sp. CIAB417]|uniref:hypothetical protein n=1 Tax=Microbacterium sp. CIAB417 TaxID=2860287 RepID=UPI001FAD5C88|nr:hypothetical protein [Microbacterium sp. CIAB417]